MEEEQNTEEKVAEVVEKAETSASPQDSGINKTVLSIVVVVILIFGALEFSGKTNIFGGGKALATVNGEKITQSEFDVRLGQILSSPQAQAFNLDDEELRAEIEQQVLDEIINTRLLLQAAANNGFTTTSERVTEEYDLIVERLGGVPELQKELEAGGITENEFLQNIEDQIVIQQFIDDNVDPISLVVSEEDIATFYESISGQEGIPPLADIEPQIRGQLASEKQQNAVSELITGLRSTGEVIILGN